MTLTRVYTVASPNGRIHLRTVSKDEAVRHAQGVYRSTKGRVTPDILEELREPTDHTKVIRRVEIKLVNHGDPGRVSRLVADELARIASSN